MLSWKAKSNLTAVSEYQGAACKPPSGMAQEKSELKLADALRPGRKWSSGAMQAHAANWGASHGEQDQLAASSKCRKAARLGEKK